MTIDELLRWGPERIWIIEDTETRFVFFNRDRVTGRNVLVVWEWGAP